MGKQIVDQTAHVIVGILAVLCLCIFTDPISSFMILIVCTFLREVWQHRDDSDFISIMDMAFWALGGTIGMEIFRIDIVRIILNG